MKADKIIKFLHRVEEEVKPYGKTLKDMEHTDQEIVDVLFNDFPKVGEQILEYLDNQN